MSRITEARNVRVGEYLHPEGATSEIREVCRITRSNPVPDPWTGRLRYTRHRFYFSSALDAAPGVEHRSDALVVAY